MQFWLEGLVITLLPTKYIGGVDRRFEVMQHLWNFVPLGRPIARGC
jgi:hypothetical protein